MCVMLPSTLEKSTPEEVIIKTKNISHQYFFEKERGKRRGDILTRTQSLGADICAQTAHEQRLERCQTKRDGDIVDGLWVALGENFDFDICVGCSVLWRVEADDAGLCSGGQERGGCGKQGGGGTHFFFSFIRVVGLLGLLGWLSLSDQSCLMFDEIEVSIDVLVRGKKRFHAEGRAGQFSCRITRSSR